MGGHDKHPVLGVDIDGVIADLMAPLKRTAEQMLRLPEGALPPPDSWNFDNWNLDYTPLFAQAAQNNMFAECPALAGCAETLADLRKHGWAISIITKRGSEEPEWMRQIDKTPHWMRTETVRWLKDRDIPYDNIFWTADKTAIPADIYIDDEPGNIEAYLTAGKKAVLFRHSYNREYSPAGAEIVASWEQIADFLDPLSGV